MRQKRTQDVIIIIRKSETNEYQIKTNNKQAAKQIKIKGLQKLLLDAENNVQYERTKRQAHLAMSRLIQKLIDEKKTNDVRRACIKKEIRYE